MLRRLCLLLAVGLLSFGIAAPEAPGARTTSRSLSRTLPEMNFDGVALTDAIDFLRDITDANIVVNWKALEGAGVTPETLVNIKLRGVSLRKALSLLLSEAGGGEGITYTIDDGVIEITTTELANQRVYTRVYDVADLLMEIPNFTDAPDFSLESQNSQGGGQGGGGGGGGGGIFGGGAGGGGAGGASGQDEEDEGPTKAERAEELLALIRETIYPDLWRENGGTASIRMFRDSMVVTAPRIVHEAIGGAWD
jgi:uncharacterized membrane protein YgcG